jgi:hypothetical protein
MLGFSGTILSRRLVFQSGLIVACLTLLALMPTVVSGDFNNDDRADLVFAVWPSPNPATAFNAVCLGQDTGAFSCSAVSADIRGTQGVAAGDLDGDGNLDAVFANNFSPNQACLGDGLGGFACENIGPSVTHFAVALGFVDGDAQLDAVFAGFGRNHVCLGDGAGGFSCSDADTDDTPSYGVALGDVDEDGLMDAVFTSSPAGIGLGPNRVCLGDGLGGFSCATIPSSSGGSILGDVALGDIDGDEHLDAVFANSGMNEVCLGDGAGNLDCTGVDDQNSFSSGVALADLNEDGSVDALFSNRLGSANRVCFGDGGGNFDCADAPAPTGDSFDVAIGDLNQDGHLDAVFTTIEGDDQHANQVCLGDGLGSLECSSLSLESNNQATGVAIGGAQSTDLICHKEKNTLLVDTHAIPAHLAHGDSIGACE